MAPHMNAEEFKKHIDGLVERFIDAAKSRNKDRLEAIVSELEQNLSSTREDFYKALAKEFYRQRSR